MQHAKDFSFKIIAKDKKSMVRVGKITTAHGIIETPSFVPVGTKASVRSLTPQNLKDLKVQILFGNTYHLHLQPGEDIVKDFGGIAKFMSWNGPTITDSGGFQVFSLGKSARSPHVADDARLQDFKSQSLKSFSLSKIRPQSETQPNFNSSASGQARSFIKFIEDLEDTESEEALVKITEDGVMFRSHIDGSRHMFTPETSMGIQKKLGADLILAFDECAPYPSTYEYAKEAMERTHNWALRSLAAHKSKIRSTKSETKSNDQNPNIKKVSNFDIRHSNFGYYPWQQALYGIVQGGTFEELRKKSAKFISELPFEGIAIGGVSVGESKKEMKDVLDWVVPELPEEKPRHLLGIGEVDDIFNAVEKRIDTFDCVIPTRFGRYGIIFSGRPEGNIQNKFRIDIKRTVFAKDQGPLCQDCQCYVCQNFTRGYINHLFKANELSAYSLASYHNLYFLNNLVGQIRKAIISGKFGEMKGTWLY